MCIRDRSYGKVIDKLCTIMLKCLTNNGRSCNGNICQTIKIWCSTSSTTWCSSCITNQFNNITCIRYIIQDNSSSVRCSKFSVCKFNTIIEDIKESNIVSEGEWCLIFCCRDGCGCSCCWNCRPRNTNTSRDQILTVSSSGWTCADLTVECRDSRNI